VHVDVQFLLVQNLYANEISFHSIGFVEIAGAQDGESKDM